FGFYKECAEFKHEYEGHAERFLQFQPRFGAQFVVSKAAFTVDSKCGAELIRIPEGVSAKCVNDEETLERRFQATADAGFWRGASIDSGFDKVPLHCYVCLFHLEWHSNIWVHVQHIDEYRYQPELRDKLVLPNHHRDLI